MIQVGDGTGEVIKNLYQASRKKPPTINCHALWWEANRNRDQIVGGYWFTIGFLSGKSIPRCWALEELVFTYRGEIELHLYEVTERQYTTQPIDKPRRISYRCRRALAIDRGIRQDYGLILA